MKLTVDLLNTFLILIALFIAYLMPFELFLISYALLGPLHYLTEINWIKDKSYFVKEKYWLQLCVVMALLIAIPALIGLDFIKNSLSKSIISIVDSVKPYTNMAIFLCLVAAFTAIFIKRNYLKVIVFFGMGILSFFLIKVSNFNLIIGIFLPTLIHVYVFTMLFMWYGTLKQSTKVGSFNVILLAAVPIIVYFLPLYDSWRVLSEYVKNVYVESKFYLLNVYTSKTIGASDGSNFNFSDIITGKIQLFISFAYTYHYLNWFSKTTIIGWHKNINKTKLFALLTIWVVSVALYAYNFKLGLILLLFLSFMHVFLEFPVNIISIKEIVKHYTKKLNSVKTN